METNFYSKVNALAKKLAKTTQTMTVKDGILQALRDKTDLPAFSATARKLMGVVNRQDVHMETIDEIVRLDPGITSRVLKLASSPSFGGQNIESIKDALLLIGMRELRKIAATMSVVNVLRHFKVKVDWELFWLHSILVANLTERLADAYREINGQEYLSGLLHDIGKLFIGHCFPEEFEMVVLQAVSQRKGMHEAEKQILDISHAEISARLCEQWKLHPEIIRSIRFHHEPASPHNQDPSNPAFQHFLATCICVADKLTNVCRANIEGSEELDQVEFTSLPEWLQLKQFTPRKTLMLDMIGELQKAKDVIAAIKISSWVH